MFSLVALVASSPFFIFIMLITIFLALFGAYR